MTFAPDRPKAKSAKPPSILGGLTLLGIGLLTAVVLPFFVPQPQGSAFTIVVVLALWAAVTHWSVVADSSTLAAR
jgi:hypothetical protein